MFLSKVAAKAATMTSLNLMNLPQQTAVIHLMTAVAVVLPAPAAVIKVVTLVIQRNQTAIMNGNRKSTSQRSVELIWEPQNTRITPPYLEDDNSVRHAVTWEQVLMSSFSAAGLVEGLLCWITSVSKTDSSLLYQSHVLCARAFLLQDHVLPLCFPFILQTSNEQGKPMNPQVIWFHFVSRFSRA